MSLPPYPMIPHQFLQMWVNNNPKLVEAMRTSGQSAPAGGDPMNLMKSMMAANPWAASNMAYHVGASSGTSFTLFT
jgi:hypothetical protein